MKKFLMASVAIAACAVAAPAFADDNTGTQTANITVEGHNVPKCNLNKDSGDVDLGSYDLTGDNGKAKTNLGQKVADGLNALNLKAWCTGGHNSVVVSRSALTTGDGNQTATGFNQAIIYDVDMNIANATRNGSPFFDGTSDGAGNGPGIGAGSGLVVPAFGPTGAGEAITFVPEPAFPTSEAASNGQAGVEAARASYATDDARLVAGDYTGTVTVTIIPGL